MTAACEQLVVTALLDDLSGFEDQEPVHATHGRETVGNDDCGEICRIAPRTWRTTPSPSRSVTRVRPDRPWPSGSSRSKTSTRTRYKIPERRRSPETQSTHLARCPEVELLLEAGTFALLVLAMLGTAGSALV